MGLTPEQDRAAWYVAGVFDGEGSVHYKEGKFGFTSKYVRIDNTDVSIIDSVCIALDLLGIPYTKRGPTYLKNDRWLPVYSLNIANYDGIALFAQLVPVQSEAKREKLDHIAGAERRRLVVRTDEEWIALYHKHSNLAAIAREVECNVKTVRTNMDRLGMPRRGRGWRAWV